tara:strand:+ start:3606 stop:4835 length:1230 start_codon:yes stop_codon:yes gene_type:complete
MTNASKFDASRQAIGYLHQIRSALLLALQHDESNDILSLEVIDDVSFSHSKEQPVNAVEVLQYKHTLSKSASLTDKSVDVWKTMRVWAERIHAKDLDPELSVFTLVTTATASSKSAIALLRNRGRSSEKARKRIEAAGAESSNKTVKSALVELNKLKVSERKLLFGNMFLIDDSPDILQSRKQIEHELRYSVDEPAKQLMGFADRLEGWWFRTAVEHLADKLNFGIQVNQVQHQVRDLLDQFKRDNLPDDLLDVIVPSDQFHSDDNRTFVLELRRITGNRNVIRLAQDNHYRAFEQRSKWVRETLLGISEEEAYEDRLLREWANKVSIALDGYETLSDLKKIDLGKQIYDWIQEAAVISPAFFIRQRFLSGYMARGSLHMLVDKNRMTWHPDDVVFLLDKLLEATDNNA